LRFLSRLLTGAKHAPLWVKEVGYPSLEVLNNIVECFHIIEEENIDCLILLIDRDVYKYRKLDSC